MRTAKSPKGVYFNLDTRQLTTDAIHWTARDLAGREICTGVGCYGSKQDVAAAAGQRVDILIFGRGEV